MFAYDAVVGFFLDKRGLTHYNQGMDNFTIVTGACGGLGKAFCEELASGGNNLFITGTNLERTKNWADELKAKHPEIKVEFCVCDLAKETDRENVFKVIKEKNLKVSRLINNGGAIVEGALLCFDNAQVLNAIRVNCEGTVDLTYKFLSEFKSDVEVLTVASLGAFYPMPYMSLYSASKRMQVNLMLALREEVKGKNIKISTLCPGAIPTSDAMKKAIKSQGLGGKLSSAEPQKIAKYSLKKLEKNKAIIIPGAFNRMLKFFSCFVSERLVCKMVGKRWAKANKKREGENGNGK